MERLSLTEAKILYARIDVRSGLNSRAKELCSLRLPCFSVRSHVQRIKNRLHCQILIYPWSLLYDLEERKAQSSKSINMRTKPHLTPNVKHLLPNHKIHKTHAHTLVNHILPFGDINGL